MELLEHLKDYPVNPIIDDGKVLYVTDKNGYRVKEEALNDSMEYVEVPSLTEHLDFHLNKILTAVDPDVYKRQQCRYLPLLSDRPS